MKEYIEVLDTTLRDGEQMKNVSYTSSEKLSLAKILLKELNVDRIEIASARVSLGEKKSVEGIINWALEKDQEYQTSHKSTMISSFIDRIEILGFTDHKKSIDWISNVGCRVINLLAKGSINHVINQLKKTQEQHLENILETLDYAKEKDILVNLYFEDWSNGMKYSKDYVYYMLENLKHTNIERFMLPDTLGILYPTEVKFMIQELVAQYPDLHFDFHAHNDYGLAVANTLASIEAGASAVHMTVNGMGERAGNAPLEEVAAGMNDFLKVNNSLNERIISRLSKEVEIFSGIRLPLNKPVLGENVYTQTAGLHADGDKKGDLYVNPLLENPERFGHKQLIYALGKLSGMASLDKNLEMLGIELGLDDKQRVLQRIIELGDKKESITEEDLPYIISNVLETPLHQPFKIRTCAVVTSTNLKPMASILIKFDDEEVQQVATGDGGYDAFMNALRKVGTLYNLELPRLIDYYVIIPRGGKSDALVQTTITWDNGIKTRGVDSDQLLSAIKATEKMVNIQINNLRNSNHDLL